MPPPNGTYWTPDRIAALQGSPTEARSGAGHFGATPGAPTPPPAPPGPPPDQGPQPPGPLSGPGIGETYGASHLGQYDNPTALETFANQQLTGDNPYYQRLQQQQADQINQQMAARGNYNSGGALSALGNASAALNAAQFKDMGDLLGQSSALGLNRQNAGMSAAGNIQNLEQNRYGQQFNEASDLAHLGAGIYGGFYNSGGQLSGDAAMAGINAGANAGGLAGQAQNTQAKTGMDLFKMMMG